MHKNNCIICQYTFCILAGTWKIFTLFPWEELELTYIGWKCWEILGWEIFTFVEDIGMDILGWKIFAFMGDCCK